MSAVSTLRAWPSRDADGRTRQKVRRRPTGDRPGCVDSREARAVEPANFLSPRQRRERIAAFRRHATDTRDRGKRRGYVRPDGTPSYSIYAGDVLDYLMHFAVQTGRVFPSYAEISEAVGCAYKTAVNCVRQLAAGGWVEWERRFVRVGSPGQAEPQVEQTSNLYRLKLPNAAQRLLDAWRARRAPPPDDVDIEAAAAATDPDIEVAQMHAKKLRMMQEMMAASRSPQDREAIAQRATALQAELRKLEAGIQARDEGSSTAPPASTQREFP
ncbi:MAG: hypothetical protein U1C74_14455 [Phenylobacterium sp.]|nr:hypothetical protein [Phenylobacterium sp.]